SSASLLVQDNTNAILFSNLPLIPFCIVFNFDWWLMFFHIRFGIERSTQCDQTSQCSKHISWIGHVKNKNTKDQKQAKENIHIEVNRHWNQTDNAQFMLGK